MKKNKIMDNIAKKLSNTTLSQRLFMGSVVFLFGTGLVITEANNAESVKQSQVKSDEKAFLKLQAKTEKKQTVKSEKQEVAEGTLQSEPTTISADTTVENVVTSSEPIATETASHVDLSSVSVSATTQYSHTENGHVEGQYYDIYSSQPTVTKTESGTTVSGTISRSGIGLEKGSIVLDYTLNFDTNGNYMSGTVSSSGYVSPAINLVAGENYTGQTVNFLSTTGGQAGSGSYVYPISAFIVVS